MSVQRYRAVVTKVDHGYEAVVREFPGLVTTDKDLLKCVEKAERTLEHYIAALVDSDLSVPLPRQDVTNEQRKGVLFALDVDVPLEFEALELKIDARLAKRIDAFCSDRSAFFRRAAEEFLAEREAMKSRPVSMPSEPSLSKVATTGKARLPIAAAQDRSTSHAIPFERI